MNPISKDSKGLRGDVALFLAAAWSLWFARRIELVARQAAETRHSAWNKHLSPHEGAKIAVYKIVAPGIQYLAPEDFPTSSSHMGPDEVHRKKGHGQLR